MSLNEIMHYNVMRQIIRTKPVCRNRGTSDEIPYIQEAPVMYKQYATKSYHKGFIPISKKLEGFVRNFQSITCAMFWFPELSGQI